MQDFAKRNSDLVKPMLIFSTIGIFVSTILRSIGIDSYKLAGSVTLVIFSILSWHSARHEYKRWGQNRNV